MSEKQNDTDISNDNNDTKDVNELDIIKKEILSKTSVTLTDYNDIPKTANEIINITVDKLKNIMIDKKNKLLGPFGAITSIIESESSIIITSNIDDTNNNDNKKEEEVKEEDISKDNNNNKQEEKENKDKSSQILSVGTLVALDNYYYLGSITDIFGPISKPFYLIRLNKDDFQRLKDSFILNETQIYVSEHEIKYTTIPKHIPGTDASNIYDEEDLNNNDYSDDEKEIQQQQQQHNLKKEKLYKHHK